jgi:hypothetical protein
MPKPVWCGGCGGLAAVGAPTNGPEGVEWLGADGRCMEAAPVGGIAGAAAGPVFGNAR